MKQDNTDPVIKEKQKILAEYREKADQIMRKMFSILVKAHHKIDKANYGRTLENLNDKKYD